MNNPYINLVETAGKVAVYEITHPKFQAQISQFGGHLISYAPSGADDILWMSETAVLDGTKAIRGGVPICWPWFGPASGEFEGEPQHGYIRSLPWQLENVEGNDSELKVRLSPNMPETLSTKLGLSVSIEFVFTQELNIHLTTTNTSDTVKSLSQAIHTYFKVSDIHSTELLGLKGVDYLDKLKGTKETQQTPLKISASEDRVYLTKNNNFEIKDQNRSINIIGLGHDSVVVWNPWQELAKNMADFNDEGYLTMICVEMANTQGLTLEPGQSHQLTQIISLK